jgi:hypothetical protein
MVTHYNVTLYIGSPSLVSFNKKSSCLKAIRCQTLEKKQQNKIQKTGTLINTQNYNLPRSICLYFSPLLLFNK